MRQMRQYKKGSFNFALDGEHILTYYAEKLIHSNEWKIKLNIWNLYKVQ